MAEIAGMLAAGALKVAAGKMAQAAGDRIMMQRRFGEDIEDLKETTRSIQAVLEDAERKSLEDKVTQLWLERLTQASYNISDMFDEFEVHASRKSALRKLKILNPCITLASEVRMASKLKKVRETLDKISNEREAYNFMISSNSGDQQVINERRTSPSVIEEKILGRDQEKQKIMTLLARRSTSSDFIVLPIYGIGGIGKTTLAQMIFNDTYFKESEKAWVYVSQTFDLKRIEGAVRSQLQLKKSQLEQDAGGSTSKSILIVLDDLWEKDDFKLDDMKDFLKIVGNGHKVHVIVTTRDVSIAEKVQTIELHNIHALSDDVCWDIIKQKSGFEHKADKERLEDIGKEIAKKCGGVALAARAIGYILKSRRDFREWVSLKDSGIWNESSHGSSPYDNVLASLKLSYNSMMPHLRLCFAYCAIFPKGHWMTKDELIYQWAALDFIKSSDEFPTWQQGEDCIKQLLGMSFFEHPKSPWINQRHLKNHITMHDLVHDLARSIMRDEVLDASSKSKFGGRKCRYVFLEDCNKPLHSFVTYPDRIRALQFSGSCSFHAGLLFAKYLRILDLEKCFFEELPSSIGQLRLLRYLNAPTTKKIPKCMTKLSKLQYLNLRGSYSPELPESIGRMEDLMYLNLSYCNGIKILPQSFGKLKNLAHLDLLGCRRIEMLPESFGELNNLAYLDLSKCQRIEVLPESFGELKNLVHLDLSECEGIRMLPESFGKLKNLAHLDLSKCRQIEMLPESFGELKNLIHLDLLRCGLIEMLPESFGKLKNLVHLDLSVCKRIKMLPESFEELENLVHLDLSRCSSLKASITGALRNLTKIQFLNLSHCHWLPIDLQEVVGELSYELRYLNLSETLAAFPYWGQFSPPSDAIGSLFDKISTLSNLEHLDLSLNGQFESLPGSFCSLRKLSMLDLTYCIHLRKLPGDMRRMDSLKVVMTYGCTDLDESTLPEPEDQMFASYTFRKRYYSHKLRIWGAYYIQHAWYRYKGRSIRDWLLRAAAASDGQPE